MTFKNGLPALLQSSSSLFVGRIEIVCLLGVVAFLSSFCHAASGQTVNDFGAWFSVNTQGKFSSQPDDSRWRWWFDGHLRYLDDSDGFNQSIFRPAIGYQLNPNTNVWLGYAWINELPASGAPVFDENRLWQQLLWSNQFGQNSYALRSRLEQRFVETGSNTGWRFRQFAKWKRPVAQGSSVSYVAWDEGFIDLNETDFGQIGSFAQNRLFLGFGFRFKNELAPKFEIGYLNQYLRSVGGDDRFNHIVSSNWFWKF